MNYNDCSNKIISNNNGIANENDEDKDETSENRNILVTMSQDCCSRNFINEKRYGSKSCLFYSCNQYTKEKNRKKRFKMNYLNQKWNFIPKISKLSMNMSFVRDEMTEMFRPENNCKIVTTPNSDLSFMTPKFSDFFDMKFSKKYKTKPKMLDFPSVSSAPNLPNINNTQIKITNINNILPHYDNVLGQYFYKTGTNECSNLIILELFDQSMWLEFDKIHNEMIVTRDGRNLFPRFAISVSNLNPQIYYSFALYFLRKRESKFKYEKSKWIQTNETTESIYQSIAYVHPDSPKLGRDWSKVIRFNRLKLTNSRNDYYKEMIKLTTLRQYVPVVEAFIYNVMTKTYTPVKQKRFEIAKFIVVTAYNNAELVELKSELNPYAKKLSNKS
ncbi:hypothetical protein A3Q56_07084 [Intoshia linei]|uniref:T-box domain-containing protein n=1 Tax=Intoshia linei TaxID=1819745 RepID=A0A177AUL0_9BILA|nr:hypothetical protein A3Q56_07084 [Intoshia linei]